MTDPSLESTSHELPPFTRARFRDLETCPRRFWLSSVAQVPWPAAPLPPSVEKAIDLGSRFHHLMHQHFLGISLDEIPPDLSIWWSAWLNHPVSLPDGRRYSEITLSVPLDGERLMARYDLIVLTRDENAMILDLKTETHPPSLLRRAMDIQTRLYSFIMVDGIRALSVERSIHPAEIETVFWLANQPATPQRYRYSPEQYLTDRDYFRTLIAKAKRLRSNVLPPAIEDMSICAQCAFRTYCSRQVLPIPVNDLTWIDEHWGSDYTLPANNQEYNGTDR